MITYRVLDAAALPQVQALYREAGWTAYLDGGPRLGRAFQNSLYCLGAFDGPQLAGFVRCVGDGEHIVLAQDLLVAGAYRRQGIGSALLRQARASFQHVRAFVLITDAADGQANAFYRALGLEKYEDMGLTGYIWQVSPRKGCTLENT